MPAGDVIKLQLESVVQGGDALGFFNGKPVFVEGGAPDEAVVCRIKEDKKTYSKAGILEILKPSPVRVQSACSYSKCGGCNLGHINYSAQLKIKTSILNESFSRVGGFDLSSHNINIEIFSSPSREYRNRTQFHCFRRNKSGIGFKSIDNNEIIAINDCPVAVSGIREALGNGSIPIPPEKDRFTVFSKDDVLLREGGVSRGKINLSDKEIILDAGLFFQSNCVMLEILISKLRDIAKNADPSLPMADLYCGVGVFALFLGDMFPSLILAEENKAAISIARENLRGKKAEFFVLKDTDWQENIFKQREKFSLKSGVSGALGFAVVDPPRAGLSRGFALALSKNGPPLLAYVSCDAASLARDSKILFSGGYRLDKLALFDFYPQTSHIESLAVFSKRN
ncbi:MAG: methyltransferase [Treponema sp.]|nr:methyltransferase [Treponema sp.]